VKETFSVNDLIAKIKDPDDKVRSAAWSAAGRVGAPAVKPLAAVATDPVSELEIGRSAKRALWKIARHAGRPGADAEKRAVAAELLGLLGDGRSVQFRRDVLWMLSEIGGDEAVDAVARLLGQADLAEDARCCLQRIPGEKSVAALKAGLASAGEPLKSALAESLRVRGVVMPDVSSKKFMPLKQTSVQPVGR
jgi:HEAT repeat protein